MSHKKAKKQRKIDGPKPKLKILWSSNAAHSSSGYGTQSKIICKKMIEAGYDVQMQAFYGLQGGKAVIDDIPVYPRLNAPWGEDGLIFHAKDMNADVVFTFQDIFPLDMNTMRQVKNWVPYAPIDGDPLSEHIKVRLNVASEIVTHSKFGHTLLKKSGYASTYIPLTVDTKALQPRDKKISRQMFKLPEDAFIFGMVAANKDNPSRKSFQEVIDAFSVVAAKHPETILYFHTNLMDQGGFPISEYCAYKGLQGRVFMLDPYTMQFKLDRTAMSHLYSAFDVLLNPSSREGFGVPVVEAQSCGIPVIVNDCQSMPELVGAGKVCKAGFKQWAMASYYPRPDVDSLIEKMEEMLVEVPKDREKLAAKARDFAVNNYDSDMVFERDWLPYLQRLERRLCKPTD